MIPYYILFLVIYISAYYDLCKGDSVQIRKSLYYVAIFSTVIFFVFFTGLKGDVGTDYQGYFNLYTVWGAKKYTDPFVSVQIEPGFWLLCHILNLLKIPFPVFWFLIACLTLSTKFIFFRKLSPYFFLSLLIYLSGLFIERDFDGIRQGLSVGVAYIAILCYMDRKKIYYCLFLLVSISIHYSSFIFVIVPVLYRVSVKNCIIYFLIGIGCVFLVLKIDILSVLLQFLPNGYITSRINTYLTQTSYSNSIGLNLGIIIRILVLILFCNLDYEKISVSKSVYNFLRNGFLFSILCFLFFNNMEIIAHRLAYGFREFQIILIPLCFKYYIMDRRQMLEMKFLGFQVYSFYAFILFYRIINTPHLREFYEYQFIF